VGLACTPSRADVGFDIVVAATPIDYERRIRPAFEDAYLVNEPIRAGDRSIGGIIHRTKIRRADLNFGRAGPWSSSAMARRPRIEHPLLGRTWFIAPEGLVLPKLEWSDGGALELHDLDWNYLRRYGVDPCRLISPSCSSTNGSGRRRPTIAHACTPSWRARHDCWSGRPPIRRGR
jgi:hypothetical protein